MGMGGVWMNVWRGIEHTVRRPRLMVPTNLETAMVVRDIVDLYGEFHTGVYGTLMLAASWTERICSSGIGLGSSIMLRR